jgi:Holliday junction resolvase RusA-like endonuclease
MNHLTFLLDNDPDIIYIIKGDPLPLARGRVSFKTKCIFDSQKTAKLVHQISLRNQHGGRDLYSGSIAIEVYFLFHIPKTLQHVKPLDYKSTKPDSDNCLKYICDVAGNGILYTDDAHIAESHVYKLYAEEPMTMFIIKELPKNAQKKI